MNRVRLMQREPLAAACVPYTAHVAPHVVRTRFGDYVTAFRLAGAAFETRDDDALNNWHERLNVLWRNIASPGVALWTHVVRRRAAAATLEVCAREGGGFADQLHARYQDRMRREKLMQNELYLSVVHRPLTGVLGGMLARAPAAAGDEARAQAVAAVDACGKLAQIVGVALARYEPEMLGCYRQGDTWCSSLLEFLGLLINGEWQRMPLPRSPLSHALAGVRLLFGTETLECRGPADTWIGAMLGIKEYPTPTSVGMYDRLLSAPFPFVLTQSFTFLDKTTAQGLLQRQATRMANAGDFAVSQSAQLTEALDALTSNEFVMGDHHFSLLVMTPSDRAGGAAAVRLTALNEAVAAARSLLADTGMLVAREDLALEAAYWAQLPGNFALRPRRAPITSRNLAAMVPFHNHPTGRATGNHWGSALTQFATSAHSLYHFSLHASDPKDPDGGSRKDTGHMLVCGPTGSGKTVFIGFLIAMLSRQGVTQIVFDKDRGLEVLLRALGGGYFPLRSGEATGFNPLQLPATPVNVEFLKGWLRILCDAPLPGAQRVADQADLDQALRGTLALDPGARRLSRLIEFLDPTVPEGVHARLSRWCEICGGEYAWAFDNPTDTLGARLEGRAVLGFDVTEFLDHALTRAPVTAYLFHCVRQLLDGRRLVCWMDEFWRLLSDPAFESFAKDGPKTWRKQNAVMCLATQSAGDVLDSAISRTLVEQTPTKVFFPNSDADAREYTEGFGLTEREFRLVKETLEPGSRRFLVKQGGHSVVCELDLKGFDAELKVISGRSADLVRLHDCLSIHGTDPAAWLPHFMNPQQGG